MSKKSKERSEKRRKKQMKNNQKPMNTKENINLDDYTLEELASMPTSKLVRMIMSHKDGTFADFAYPYHVMMEAHDLIIAYNTARARCLSDLMSDLDEIGVLNERNILNMNEQAIAVIHDSTDTKAFKRMREIEKKAIPMLEKLERAIQLMDISLGNHTEMNDEQKCCLRGIMLTTRAELLQAFSFVFNPDEEETTDD